VSLEVVLLAVDVLQLSGLVVPEVLAPPGSRAVGLDRTRRRRARRRALRRSSRRRLDLRPRRLLSTRHLEDEDEAARNHPARHELTIDANFRAITDLTAHWRPRYRAVPGAQTVIEAHVPE
jgi:hypothetical protein